MGCETDESFRTPFFGFVKHLMQHSIFCVHPFSAECLHNNELDGLRFVKDKDKHLH